MLRQASSLCILASAVSLILSDAHLEKTSFIELIQSGNKSLAGHRSTEAHIESKSCHADGKCDEARELLRYMTPYNTGLDVMYDVSAHAPHLMNQKKPVKFYSFIDTWSSGVPRPYLWEDGLKENCQAVTPISGDNGFEVHAELHYWEQPNAGKVTKVVSAQTPAPFGGPLILGEPQVTTAKLRRNVTAPSGRMQSFLEIDSDEYSYDKDMMYQKATIYKCKNKAELQQAMRHRASGFDSFASFLEMDTMDGRDLSDGREVTYETENTIRVHLNDNDLNLWKVGAKVFAPKHAASTDFNSRGSMAETNEAVGVVKSIHTPKGTSLLQTDSASTALVEVNSGCPCLKDTQRAWLAKVQKNPETHIGNLVELGEAIPEKNNLYRFTPLRSSGGSFVQEGSTEATEEDVCMVRTPSPRLLETEVDLGTPLADNERVFAHLVGTGHGWEHTNNQCGEFCPVEYTLTANGKATEKFRVWREDCGSNPNGMSQEGTWRTSRNGWCPGSMSQGWWGDVTSHVKSGGKVPVALDAHVQNGEATGTYVNSAGFNFDDKAMLQTSLTFHRYTMPPVDAGAGTARSASALLEDSAMVRSGNNKHPGMDGFGEDGYISMAALESMYAKDAAGSAGIDNPFARATKQYIPFAYSTSDLESARGSNAPWFPVNEDALRQDKATHVVPILTGDIHQMATRTILATADTSHIDPTKTYQVGLRLRVEGPPSPFIQDKWDRYASIGVFV